MHRKVTVSSFELIMSLSYALDLVDPSIANHHKRVAYLAAAIAEELGMPKELQHNVTVAGVLHDIGALSLEEINKLHVFGLETNSQHAEIGYRLISNFAPFRVVAPIIRYHHQTWEDELRLRAPGERVPLENHILFFADQIEVCIDRRREILGQVPEIVAMVRQNAGTRYMPEVVDAFLSLADREFFWLDITSTHIDSVLKDTLATSTFSFELGLGSLLSITKLFSQIIDFRSPFTATHSSGVAAVGDGLSQLLGFSRQEGTMMRVAGYLHDLGKLSVPPEILNKPGKLDDEEMRAIRKHTYYTFHTLKTVKELETINAWASYHHETLDGMGYPFHYGQEDLQLGARILAVADIFTALTEERPYRAGMHRPQVLEILTGMAATGKIDRMVVNTLEAHYDTIDGLRLAEQQGAVSAYEHVIQPAQTA